MSEIKLSGWLDRASNQMSLVAHTWNDNHRKDLLAFSKDIKTASEIALKQEQESFNKESELRSALLYLWSWVKADIEHFNGSTPDDHIIDAVFHALDFSCTEKPDN